MQTINKRISFFASCLSVVTALVFGSCVNEELPCPAEPADSQGVTIKFSLVTRSAVRGVGSRALVKPANPQDGSAAENYLDLDNLRFLLFDGNQTLLRAFAPEVNSEDSEYKTYDVKAFFPGTVEDVFGVTSTASDVTFSIVVLGNYANLTPEGFSYHPGQKLSEIFDRSSVATFAMPGSGWQPSVMDDNHIPMAGMQTFKISKTSLEASTHEAPVQLYDNEISMLRALAKIEVIDRIGIVDGVQLPVTERNSIEKAELIGHTARGSMIPTFVQWSLDNSIETQYVTNSSVPLNATYIGYEPNAELTVTVPDAKIMNFFYDADATDSREDGCRVFSCYLTEYNPADRGTSYPMWIRITAQSPGVNGEVPSSSPYRLEVAPYTNNVPGESLSILRNNIYRYEITGVAGSDLELTVEAAPWNESPEYNIDFTQTPTIKDLLDWDGNVGDIDDDGNVVVQPWTDTPHPLIGDFFLQGPLGGTWTASLLTLEGAQDAFYFIDEKGNEVGDQFSGDITGTEQQKFRIVSRNPAPTSINRAKLQILVTVGTPPNATVTEVFLGPKNATYTNFTIVQNPQ